MNKCENRYILTGGPGSGKSTLLTELSKNGYQCFEEISRIVIREQHSIGGNKVPWSNLADFAEICYERMCSQLVECQPEKICFYDRGLPDVIAYMRRGGLSVPQHYFDKCNEYNSTVFITPPWQEIFINDDERPESFKDAEEIFIFLKNTYIELDFDVIELPKASLPERVRFVESYLSSANDSRIAL